MTDAHGPNGPYSEVFEDGKDLAQPQSIHRIRANSSIMQLKKILGELSARPTIPAGNTELQLRSCRLVLRALRVPELWN
jgi:hypothetical protein